MSAIQKPTTAPSSDGKGKLSPSRRAHVAEAVGLIPRNAMNTLTGDVDDGTEVDALAPAPAAADLAAPSASAANVQTPEAAPAPVAPAAQPQAAPGEPNPWDEVKRLDAQRLEDKRALKALQEQLAKLTTPQTPQGPQLSIEELQKDPFAALKKAGLSYHDLTERMVNGGGPTVHDALTETQRIREAALAEVNAVRGEVAQLRNGLTRERLELGLQKSLATDPRFDLLAADPESAVTEAISELAKHYSETGERLPDQNVLATIQRRWVDRLRKLDSHKAASRVLGHQSGTPAPATSPAASPPNAATNATATQASAAIPPPTLTNDVSASSPRTEPMRSLNPRALDRKLLIRDVTKRLVPPNPFGEDEE